MEEYYVDCIRYQLIQRAVIDFFFLYLDMYVKFN